jgi:hypothetical protein
MVMKMSTVVFWVVMPCLADGFNFESGGDTFLQNVRNHLQNYTSSQPKIPQSKSILSICLNSLFIRCMSSHTTGWS